MTHKPTTQALITIEMDNAAFDDAPATELARILQDLAERIVGDGIDSRTLQDINGNAVGNFYIDSEGRPPQAVNACPDILRVLDISTAHIAPETMQMLDTTHYDRWPVTGGPKSYGYFMYAPEADDPAIPRDLWACFEFAREHGCTYLCFDADADRYPPLKDYHP